MSDIDLQEYGRLQAVVEAQGRDIERMAEAVEKLSEAMQGVQQELAAAKGGWRTLMLVGGAAATLGAMFSKFAAWIVQGTLRI